jgi:hypothetical protein
MNGIVKKNKLPNGSELIETNRGSKYWYLNGNLHREDGPAIERFNGDKSWYVNDKRHREDGPAIEWSNGDKFWYINDIQIPCKTQEEFERLMRLKSFW